ncbi:membrane protein insertion efficiency factor YidD [Actinoplanes oblitus]|uniref:Membrane protein insertion efficiency factor YidD n=1 Tax=Actinoplanes oblitus TaxID=3040509 RepID=A0ABY8WED0_9ACTN|nr:membrane protein insertion efficiency factor YidD [Actinoplanes oblitus]WIM94843.1 membrane protein insertion efficiency factor YidD [Actinoplanes oblitus]
MEDVPDDPQEPQQKKEPWYHNCDCDPGCPDCDIPGCHCDVPGCDLFRLSTLLTVVALLGHGPAAGPAQRMVTGAIRGYRKVSPKLPTRCRYQPTCSAYALAAVEKHGLRKGLRLAVARLRRCGPRVPFGTGDPVP